MTVSDACTLVADLTRKVSRARRERDAWRLIAQQAIHHAHGLHVEIDRLGARYHALLDERRQRREAA